MSLLVCDLTSQHFSNPIVYVARAADFPDLGRRVPWIIRRDASDIGSSAESKGYGVTRDQSPRVLCHHKPLRGGLREGQGLQCCE